MSHDRVLAKDKMDALAADPYRWLRDRNFHVINPDEVVVGRVVLTELIAKFIEAVQVWNPDLSRLVVAAKAALKEEE